MENFDPGSATYLVLLGLLLAAGFWTQARSNMNRTLQHAAIWGLIFVGAIAAAGLWGDISKGLTPQQASFDSEGAISVPISPNGHFHLTLDVNGAPIEFVVDTGATDIVLSQQDAIKAGLDVDELAFLGRANTANGEVNTAIVRLDTLVIGPHTDTNVRAIVNEGDMFGSLLGMGYLQRWGKIEMTANTLILSR